MNRENRTIIILAIVIIVGITILGLYNNQKKGIQTKVNNKQFFLGELSFERLSEISGCEIGDNKDEFAKCLNDKGLTMYGTYWCSHCQNQKKLFGDSFKYINYVECTENVDYCVEKGVQGYPSWILESTTTLLK